MIYKEIKIFASWSLSWILHTSLVLFSSVLAVSVTMSQIRAAASFMLGKLICPKLLFSGREQTFSEIVHFPFPSVPRPD